MKTINLICLAICIVLVKAEYDVFGLNNEDGFESRIVGGKQAKKGQFPYQVSLRKRLTKQHYCGASIISNRYMLTAAHCTHGVFLKPPFIVAVVGTVLRHFDGVTIKLQKVNAHEGFNRQTLVNDIALIRTASEIRFTQNIQPIALPQRYTGANSSLVLSGWGGINVFN